MKRLRHRWLTSAVFVPVILLLLSVVSACSSTKHVPAGQLLLDDASIKILDRPKDVSTKELENYLRQVENHKVLGGMKLQLALYNMSGHDSTKWFNRWAQRIGTPPVIYDSTLTIAGANQLQMALSNKGYMKNEVTYDVKRNERKKKARVTYNITLGEPYYVRSVAYNVEDDSLRDIVLADTANFPIKSGSLLDHNKLNVEREHITSTLRNKGYYAFSKDNINFTADTAANSRAVDLTLNVLSPEANDRAPYYTSHRPFYVRSVTVVTNYDAVAMHNGNYFGNDTTSHRGINIIYGDEQYLKPEALAECCHIEPMQRYSAANIERTYQALSRLGIVKFINITTQVVGEVDGKIWLDTYVLLTRDKSQSVSLSVEGTNSEGDLGFGIGVDYTHNNAFRGSEKLNAKFKVSYESISGDLSGLINDNYSEYAGEVGITFPKFLFPFLTRDFKRSIQASTEFSAGFNYQARPEYTRIIASTAWRYVWTKRLSRSRHVFNLLDLNYVYLPKKRHNFLDSISNPLLRYSYEDHMIMRLGYSYYHTNKVAESPLTTRPQRDIYTIRASAETAGNLLYGLSNLFRQTRGEDDAYKVFGIRYSQYVKLDGDFAWTHTFDTRNNLSAHVGLGVAVPYGNSSVIPFEKRFYSGGANSVRGWGVRTLGPGSFNATNSQNRFIYQCGDIRFDANIEYRAKLFWVIEMGLFIDAGNIWTIRDYEDQPGGVFKFDKFYEQIAVAYGLGLRMDFKYFLVRLDMGMKAHNPASQQEHWPLFSPKFKRDAEFHFSVGYPF